MIDYNRIASEYARHRQVHPEVLKNLFVTGNIGAAAKILEVGCGTGNYIIALEALAGCSGWGIDASEKMLAKAAGRSEKIDFQAGQAEKLDFPPAFFDFVFSVDVIHHVVKQFEHFQAVYRVLKVGGKVCTVTDSDWIIRHRQPLSNYFPETIGVELERYPSISKLRDMMDRVGFTKITEHTVEFSYQLTDIQPYYDKAFSSLHLIREDAFQRGLNLMEQDLRVGPIQGVSRYLLLWGTK